MKNALRFNIGVIGKLSHHVCDLAPAIDFYKNKLGFKHLFTRKGKAFFECGGMRFLLNTQLETKSSTEPDIAYLRVEDIQAAYEELCERGIIFDEKPRKLIAINGYELWAAFFHDQDNNLLGLLGEH
jgi:catechol 2,3-dioxygenase-like lactoylglutathione lyase family enzyme